MTSLELLAPDDMRGRVVQTALLLISGITSPIGLIAEGWLMTHVGVRPVLMGMGMILMTFAAIGMQMRVFKQDTELEAGFKRPGRDAEAKRNLSGKNLAWEEHLRWGTRVSAFSISRTPGVVISHAQGRH
jgi:hypothetical protein